MNLPSFKQCVRSESKSSSKSNYTVYCTEPFSDFKPLIFMENLQVGYVENPRVDGSIPSQATKQSRQCESTDGFSVCSAEKAQPKKNRSRAVFFGN